jgi:N-acyl-L-homoserine lactone synthetase
MIVVIEPNNAREHSHLIDEMFRLRARVFRDRLDWDVQVSNGMERDKYDDEGPVYLIYVNDDTREVKGCLRLLPTTGPTLLADIFADTLPGAVHISAPTIWECTRFCLGDGDREEVLLTSAALIIALGDVAINSGIDSIIGNFDSAMLRLYRRLGCEVDVLGSTRRYGQPVYLGLFPISQAVLTRVKRRLNSKRSMAISNYKQAHLLNENHRAPPQTGGDAPAAK